MYCLLHSCKRAGQDEGQQKGQRNHNHRSRPGKDQPNPGICPVQLPPNLLRVSHGFHRQLPGVGFGVACVCQGLGVVLHVGGKLGLNGLLLPSGGMADVLADRLAVAVKSLVHVFLLSAGSAGNAVVLF